MWRTALVSFLILLPDSIVAQSRLSSRGDVERGSLEIDLHRGAVPPFEILVTETPAESMHLSVDWNAKQDRVHLRLRGKKALVRYPDIDRKLGENYYPNAFFPEPEDIEGGRYQLWIVSAAGPKINFYYNPDTLDLLGSEFDFESPPSPIAVPFPTLYLFPTPMFQPDENGDVDFEWTFAYSAAKSGDRPDLAHFYLTFPPPNLGQANPFRIDLSTLRPYASKPVPAELARPFSDYLRGGMFFDVTIEPAAHFTEPPIQTGISTYSGATAVAGGIPPGWMLDINAAFMNVGPPITLFPGRNGEPFYFFHGTPPEVNDELRAMADELNPPSGRTLRPFGRECYPAQQHRQNGNGGYNLHLESTLRFHPIKEGADSARGQALFGLAADGQTEDNSQAIFEGDSIPFGGQVVSNGRSCFTCHRGPETQFGFPSLPLSQSVPLDDPLFTGIDGDAQFDPDGMSNLDKLGLIKIRPNRFDPRRSGDDPFSQVFAWRKSVKLINLGLQQGFLTDLRGRVMFETERGAVFSHTQVSDQRFDDLFSLADGSDIESFLFGITTDPRLTQLRDGGPLQDKLIKDPYATVTVETQAEKRGQKVFHSNCFVCHDTPNVFSGLANVEPLGAGDRTADFPSFAPAVGTAYNIGVSERNKHKLRFTHNNGGNFTPIVIPLAKEDGQVLMQTVNFDIGLAATTGRAIDIGRFKVPQLRNLKHNAPYFHDNSANTIEEVVEYFTSNHYRNSADGRSYPIRLNQREKQDLIAFLKRL